MERITTVSMILIFCGLTKVDSFSQDANAKADRTTLSSNPIIVHSKLDFGSGYNSASGKEYFAVFNYESSEKNTELVAGATGSTGYSKIELIETKEKLRNVLNIDRSLELKISYIGGSASSSFKEKIYNETELNKFKQIAIVKAEYVNDPRVYINPEIKDKLIKLAKRNPTKFMLTAGDMFVSKVFTGGNLYGLFELESRNKTEIRKNENFFQFTASYLGNSISTSTNVTKVKESFNETKQIKSLLFTEGGKNALPGSQDIGAFLNYVGSFKTDITNAGGSPVVLYVELQPYESIAGFPKIDFSPIRKYQREFLLNAQEIYDRLDKSVSNARFVLEVENISLFTEDEVKLAKKVLEKYDNYYSILEIITRNAINDFRNLDNESLLKLDTIKAFEPQFDYSNRPYNESISLKADESVQVLITNSEGSDSDSIFSGKYLYIEGQLGSSINHQTNSEKLKPVSYKLEYEFVRKGLGILKYNVFAGYSNPYYQVKFRDATDNSKIIYDMPWVGDPIPIHKNVSVEVCLINPNKVYYLKIGNKYQKTNYSRPYKLIKEPMLINPRIVHVAPVAKIYNQNIGNTEDAKTSLGRKLKSLEFDFTTDND